MYTGSYECSPAPNISVIIYSIVYVTIQYLRPHTHLLSPVTAQERNVKNVTLQICQQTSTFFHLFHNQDCALTCLYMLE